MKIEVHGHYRIACCSGEVRDWEYLGVNESAVAWWRDTLSGRVFSEDSLMYAWQIIGRGIECARHREN
jgi:hypothetical protein